jgi:hypothetical protein
MFNTDIFVPIQYQIQDRYYQTILMKKAVAPKAITAFILYTVLWISSCKNDVKKPDVSAVSTELDVKRFEKDLFNVDVTQPDRSLEDLRK